MSENSNNCKCGNSTKDDKLEKIIAKYTNDKSNLIQMLNEIQESYGYVPEHCQARIAEYLNIPRAEVYGVITFYSRFTLKPKGKHTIAVCLGTACYVKGSQKILDELKKELKIEDGETTEDGKFSLEAVRCIGSCSMAPIYKVDEDVYGKAKVDEVKGILQKYN